MRFLSDRTPCDAELTSNQLSYILQFHLNYYCKKIKDILMKDCLKKDEKKLKV